MTQTGIIYGCRRWLLLSILIATSLTAISGAQSRSDVPGLLQKAEIAEIIDSVLTACEIHYVYPDTAHALSEYIRKRFADGVYDDITNLTEIAQRLDDDLLSFTNDRHLHISVMSRDDSPSISDTLTNEAIARRARTNFGFRKAEWLPGNIGYLQLDSFEDAVYAGETATAAMSFLARCNALIIDLRYNGGGYETMVRLLASYFFKSPIKINELYFPETDSLEQSWTSAYVPGRKLVDTELYILISDQTASGAEAFAYGMKHSSRAVLIGETTVGMAHWTESWDFPNLGIRADIPIARPVNPVTKTSWERTGVKPHIEVSTDSAFDVAYANALRKLLETEEDERSRAALVWVLDRLEVDQLQYELDRHDSRQYVGTYGPRHIWLKDGVLHYRRGENDPMIMIPMKKDLFRLEGIDYFRIQFTRNERDEVIELVGLYDDGRSDASPRTE
jgi:hypothetical protein